MNRTFILRTILLPILLSASALGVAGQKTVSVFLKPDPSSYLVTTLPADDSRLANASEMPYNPGQKNIWKWLELNQTFEGHVRKTYVTKGLTIQVGAPVYFIPGNEDAFLTILEDVSKAEVIQAGGDWVKVSIEASIPAYFETSTRAPVPAVAEKAPARPETFREPVATADDYNVESAVVQDETRTQAPADLNSGNPYPGEPIDRVLEGKLLPYKPMFSNPWSKPTYKWEILNRGKKRMAFVDTTSLILNRPIEYYSGKQVSLSGSIYQINKGRDLVIVANQITIQ